MSSFNLNYLPKGPISQLCVWDFNMRMGVGLRGVTIQSVTDSEHGNVQMTRSCRQ